MLAGIIDAVLRPTRARRCDGHLRGRGRGDRARPSARRRRTQPSPRPAPRRQQAAASPRRRPAIATRSGRPSSGSSTRWSARLPFVINGRLDVLASNELGGRSTHRSTTRSPTPRTTPGSSSSIPGPPSSGATGTRSANDTVAMLRTEAGRDPYDRELTDLVGELSTRSEEFRVRWADHNVRRPRHRPQKPSTTRPSATSTCLSSSSHCQETPAKACSPTPQSPHRHRRKRSNCWLTGQQALPGSGLKRTVVDD